MRRLVLFVLFFLCTHQQFGQIAFTANIPDTNTATVDVTQSLTQAFTYSPNLQMMQEARQQAEHEVRRAEAGYYPTIGIWAGGGAVQESTTGTRASSIHSDVVASSTLGLLFSQTLWQGGATSSLVRSRESSLAMSVFDVLDTASALALNTIGSHLDVVRRRALLALAENNVLEHQSILRILQTRFAQGLSSKGDVEQVISRLNRAEATRLAHQEGLDAALANYRRITGQYASKNLSPVANPLQMFDNIKTVRDLCAQNNYSLQSNMARIDAFLGERDFTRANFAPFLTLDAGPAYTNIDRDGDTYELSWSLMLNMRWNVYNGGADQAGFEAASAQVRQARKALHSTMDVLDEQISLAYNRTVAARKQAEYFNAASKASRIAKDNFTIQFQAGQKDLLNVLDAETEYFTAAVESIIASTDATLGQYRMHALAGTLLATVGIDSASVSEAIPVRTTIDDVSAWSFTKSPRENTIANTSDSTLQRD